MLSWDYDHFRKPLRVLAAACAVAAALPLSAAADGLPLHASVTVDERGFSPASVAIAAGGSVTWTNTGNDSHNVETGSAPLAVEFGLSPGQAVTWSFGLPGVYHYTASTDCLNGVTKALFACLDYTVNVLNQPPGTPLPSQAAQAPASPAPTASPTPVGQTSTVTVEHDPIISIDDNGFSPAVVAVSVNGTVTWINHGYQVHTASSTATGGQLPFDTGGLGPSQKMTFGFFTPSQYSYTSAPDCLHNQHNPAFNCGPYTLIVTAAPAGSTVPLSSPLGVAPPPSAVPAASTSIGIDDSAGFQPQRLTIKLGQSITWTNKGVNVHSVVADTGVAPAFDSGGLGPGQSFTWTPTEPGSYGYHSSVDATYITDPVCNCTAAAYGAFAGTVVVGQ